MERPSPRDKIEVQILPPDEAFLPRNFKVCTDIEMPGQEAITDLTDKDRIRLGKEVVQTILNSCPKLGPILMTVDGAREGVINVSIYTNSLSDITTLRDTKGIGIQFTCDISDQENPRYLSEEHWLKR